MNPGTLKLQTLHSELKHELKKNKRSFVGVGQ